jgi:xylulokinase
MRTLLGIDLGTTGIRALLLGAAGKVLAVSSQEYVGGASWVGQAGSEAQAEVSIFWAALRNIISATLETACVSPSTVQGIAISAMAPDAVAVDARGQALMPCILWMDRRAVFEAEKIGLRIGQSRVFRVNGNPIDPYYGLVKTLWIKNNAPDVYRRATKILNLKDYLVGRMTGKLVTDVSHAALSGIAYDIRQNVWDLDMLKELELDPAKLPDPLPSEEIAGSLTFEAASELGLAAGTPVAAGMIDSAAGYLACGCVTPGQSAMTLGTSSCWGIYSDKTLWPKGMNITKAPWNPKGYLINASLAAGGAVISWLRNLFFPSVGTAEHDVQFHDLEERAARVPIGSRGLMTLPHFLGERAPFWDPDARGVLFGLHLGHRREDLYRSAMEGIALSFYRDKLLLEQTGVVMEKRILTTGGSARSSLLRRILADALNFTVDHIGEEARSDYGAAWLAGKATGVFPGYGSLGNRNRIVESVEPDAAAHRQYTQLYDRIYRDLYPRIKDMYPRATI